MDNLNFESTSQFYEIQKHKIIWPLVTSSSNMFKKTSTLTKIKLKMTPEEEDKNANIVRDKDGNAIAVESMYGTKQESDVDVALNLQAESQRGK